jgi:hypothetical protein
MQTFENNNTHEADLDMNNILSIYVKISIAPSSLKYAAYDYLSHGKIINNKTVKEVIQTLKAEQAE